MPHLFLLIFIFLLNFPCFLDNSSPNILNNYLSEKTPNDFITSIFMCVFEYLEVDNNKSLLIPKCIINKTKGNEGLLIDILKNIKDFELLISITTSSFDKNGIAQKIIDILEEDANNEYILINSLYSILNETDKDGLKILDYVYRILEELQFDNAKRDYILKNASLIFQNFNTSKFYNHIKENHPKVLIDLIVTIFENAHGTQKIYEIIRNNSRELHDEVIFLFIDVIINFIEEDKSLRIIGDFLYNHHPEALGLFKLLMVEDQFKGIINDYFNYEDIIIKEIIKALLGGGEIYELFFEVFQNRELLKEGIEIVINFKKNKLYVENNLAIYLKNISIVNGSYIPRIVNSFMNITKNLNGQEGFWDIIISAAQRSLHEFFDDRNALKFNISESCIELFEDTFFNNNTNWKEVLLFYLKKFIFASPRNKGDFLDFDNCMDLTNYSDVKDIYEKNNMSYQVEPAFIIGILDNPQKKIVFKNSTFYEKYYYIYNLCLPYGYRNNDTTNIYCNETDYSNILNFVNSIYTNLTGTNIQAIILNKNKVELKSSDYSIGIFSILILLIPIFIKIFLMISKCIINRRNKNIDKINNLISLDKDNKQKNKNESHKGKEYIISNKKEIPKYQKLLNEYFAFIKNGRELFNFDLNTTNFNNVNGLTYIKGLIGLSIILTVFGLTFTILINLPMKEYGSWHFQRTIKSFIFFILFIGYRYSPRILFSCSGYTLIYKYLCFIKQEQGLYFLKFIFLQSYKYILLYFILILYRFSAHEIIYVFRRSKRPSWMLYEHYLKNENNFIKGALSFLFHLNSSNNDYTEKQNLI